MGWTSDLDGNIGQGGDFVRGTLQRGNHTITAKVTDSSGLMATATRAVQVIDEAAPVVTITQPDTGSVFGDVKPITLRRDRDRRDRRRRDFDPGLDLQPRRSDRHVARPSPRPA